MDSIACWNVRGLNKASRRLDVKSFLSNNKTYLVGLLETKIRLQRKNRVLKAFKDWQSIANYDYCPDGRIWMLWKPAKCSVICLQSSSQFMHCEVLFYDLNVKVLITFIYGFNTTEERESLWAALRRISLSITGPWMLLGDLNTTLLYDEKIKGGEVLNTDTEELASFVEAAEVLDMKYTGHRLTWCNNREGLERMYCKLDRVLINSAWFNRFPLAETIFLDRSSSDHSPSLVRLHDLATQGKHIFKYCNFWSKNEQFMPLVSQAWSTSLYGTPMYILVQKLKLVKTALKQLHRSEYAKLCNRVEEKRQVLAAIQSSVQENPLDIPLQR